MKVVDYGMIGEKVGMTRIFTPAGVSVPVTVIKCGPCYVVDKKTEERDGYQSWQIGYGEVKEKKLNQPRLGHLKKSGVPPLRSLKEFSFKDAQYQPGEVLKVDGFKIGDRVDVTGKSKGKGFAGVVKRFGYQGGRSSHGSMFHRAPGSIGGTGAGRVFKGKGLPGRMGGEKVTVRNLEVVGVNVERDLLLLKGAVPGPAGSQVVIVRRTTK